MNIVLMLSGGIGRRLGTDTPKQYLEVCGRPVVTFAAEPFLQHGEIDAMQIVADPVWQEAVAKWLLPYDTQRKIRGFCLPGENRQLSVLHGLEAISSYAGNSDCVLIHDAARPQVSQRLITACLEAVGDHDGVMPVLPVKDTIYASEDGNKVSALLNRDQVFAGQAPELFRFGPYYKANRRLSKKEILHVNGSTEPAVLAGMDIALLPGDEDNFKITTRKDWEHFREIVEKKKQEDTA